MSNLILHVQLAESEAVRSAHWRGMQSLAALCLAYGPGIATAPGLPANTDLQVQLQWLIGIDQVCTSVSQLTAWPCMHASTSLSSAFELCVERLQTAQFACQCDCEPGGNKKADARQIFCSRYVRIHRCILCSSVACYN